MASSSASQRIKDDKDAFSGIEPLGKRRKIDESSRLFDVFINHRGPDVKQTLALSLYKSLAELGIDAFLDSEEKELGDSFPSTIEGAILSASVHIAIFSKHYAESPWCLAELVLMSQSSAKIIPVFYGVEPSALRHVESGLYAEAFTNYEEKKRYIEKLPEWKEVLHYVSFLTGYEIRGDFSVSDYQSIVSAVRKEVQRKELLHVAKYPVGLDRVVTGFDRQCETKESGKEKGLIVGIFGMGGVGKTTLAKELFNRKQSQYTKTCFLFDVREAYANKGFPSLQMKLLKDLYHQENLNFQCIEEGKSHIQGCIRRKRQLSFILVLDDIDHLEQLDALLISDMLNKFVHSLVIVTTRDAGLLTNAGIRVSYNLEGINESEGKQLFCLHALSGSYPSSGYEKLVDLFVDLCGGLPLSLQVLGGHVHGTDHKFWKLELEKFKKTVPQDIEKRLRISIDTLDNDEKQIFMDVACFFIGEFAKDAIKVWEASGWSAQHALRRLKDKCLVEEGEEGEEMGVLRMHDHLRDLGRKMADELNHPCRLWRSQHLQSLEAKGFENILRQPKFRYLHSFMDQPLARHIKYFLGESENTLEPSTALLWLECHGLTNIPPWIPLQNLQALIIRKGKLEKVLPNYKQEPLALRELRIYNSLMLEELCLGLLPRLEELVIHNCRRLKTLTGVSVLASLVNLEIVGCEEVEELCLVGLTSVENIIIHNCERLISLTGVSELASLRNLKIVGCGEVEELCLAGLICAENIIIHNFWHLKSLTGVSVLATLVNLEIIGCGEVEELCLVGLTSVENIIIDNCEHLKSLIGVSELASLRSLKIVGCGEVEELCLAGLTCAENIIIHNFWHLKSLTGVSVIASLVNLEIVGCGEVEELCLVGLTSVENIIIHNCEHLKSLTGVSELVSLRNLKIIGCGEVEELCLAGLICAENIIIHNFWCLKSLTGVSVLASLVNLEIVGCEEVEELCFIELTSIENIIIDNCEHLKSLTGVSELASLRNLKIIGCGKVTELCLAGLICVENIIIHNFCSLESLTGVSDLACLVNWEIIGCGEVEELCLAGLISAENIIIHNCGHLRSLTGVSDLASLMNLEIVGCGAVEELCLVGLISAKTILIHNCGHLKSLTGVSDLASLMNLEIVGCGEVEELFLAGLISAENIIIHNCGHLKSLTGVSNLASLMNLEIVGCGEVEELCLVGLKSAENIIIHNFGRLKILTGASDLASLMNLEIVGCKEVEELCLVGLSCLREISIHGCGKLKSITASDLRLLAKFDIVGCRKLEELSLVRLKSAKKIIISECELAGLMTDELNKSKRHDLKEYKIHDLKSVSGITDHVSGGVSDLTKLVQLNITECAELKIDKCEELEELHFVGRSSSSNFFTLIKVKGCENLISINGIFWKPVQFNVYDCPKLEKIPDMERFKLSETVQFVYCRNETIWNYTLKMKKLPSQFIKLLGRAADGAASILNANIFCDFFFAKSIIQNGVQKICEHLGGHVVAAIVFCAVVVINSRTAARTINEIIREYDNPWLKYEVRQGEWIITSVTSNQDDIHRYIVNKGDCFPFDCLCFSENVTIKSVTMPVMRGEEHKVLKVLHKIVDELYQK